ncbi:MAG: Ig-like domain-containing protein [Methylococcales bacterium]
MKQFITRFIISLGLGLTFNLPLQAGVVDLDLEVMLKKNSPNQLFPVIVTLNTQANLNTLKDRDKAQHSIKTIQALRNHANFTQPAILAFLKSVGATNIKPLWIINSIAVTLPARMVRVLSKLPGVARVYMDMTLSVSPSAAATASAPEWNISAIHAPELWGMGNTGQGVVIANMDTGVDVVHPDLATRWRGGTNSWYDPHGQYPSPTDYAGALSGHGTQTMGLIVGGNTGGTTIGTAPGAKWIAAKVFNNQGTALESHFHQSFQWLIDPDNNPLTNDAPDVVNGSFQTALSGICDNRFQTDIQMLKTAGIAVVFAAGNNGPGISSSSSPANNPGSFAVGAVDYLSNIAAFSARGPAPVGCGGTLFPNMVAPGVDVVTSDLTFAGQASYTVVSGTSFAAPHVAGGMALLIGAFPNVPVTTLESALLNSATDLSLLGPDNESGYGLLNVLGAYTILANSGQNPVGVDDSYILDEDATLTVPAPGILSNDSDPQNNPVTALLNTTVSHGSLTLNSDGSFSYTPANNYNGTDSFVYKVSDGLHESGLVTVVITINPLNDAPVAQADTALASNGGTLAIPVLTNDSDLENSPLTPVIDTNPSNGSVSVDSAGLVVYTHNSSQTVADSFTYHVTDGDKVSNTATVNISIGPASLTASPDEYSVAEDTVLNVTAPGILGNDSPNNGLTAQLVSAPAHAAAFNINPDGSFSYTPTANYNGTDSFVYKASNTYTQSDNTLVTLTVSPVNDAPVATNDRIYSVISGQLLNVAATSGVLSNDSDQENATLSAVLVAAPSAGLLGLNADGSFSFNSAGLVAGSYTFSYLANDGMAINNQSNTAVATINVLPFPINTAPIAKIDTFLYRPNVTRTVNGSGALGLGVLMNDTDAENNNLSAQFVTNSLSGGGTLSLNANGSFNYVNTTSANVSFRYRANDGALLSFPATGTAVSLRADAAPTTAGDNCVYDISNNATTVAARCIVLSNRIIKMAVTLNDTDPNKVTNIPTDGIGSTVVNNSTLVSSVGTGVNVLANPQCGQPALGTASPVRGSITNNCDGSLTISVSSGNNINNINYTYRVSDDLGAQSNLRSVSLSVQP